MAAVPPSEISAEEVRTLAAAWSRRLDDLAHGMYDALAAQIPELADDPEIAGLTLASCASNIEAVLSMMRHGIPASATEAPVAALEHARRMAARGGGIDATLRFYRLGHAFFWDRWSTALVAAITDPDRLDVALRETAAFVFGYIDALSIRVEAEQLAERDRRQQRAAIVRVEAIRAIMEGEDVDPQAAERALGHRFDGQQLAFLCWTDRDAAGLDRLAFAVAQALGAARPLVLPDGTEGLGVWVTVADGAAASFATVETAVRGAGSEARVALGTPAPGVSGFRTSRLQAERARHVARLSGARAAVVTAYADVALVDLLSQDLPAARGFVATELGGLVASDDTSERLREALLAVVRPHGGLAAAARALDVHRNTVLQRVHRAEALRGRAATERPAELHAALLLAQALGPAVLSG